MYITNKVAVPIPNLFSNVLSHNLSTTFIRNASSVTVFILITFTFVKRYHTQFWIPWGNNSPQTLHLTPSLDTISSFLLRSIFSSLKLFYFSLSTYCCYYSFPSFTFNKALCSFLISLPFLIFMVNLLFLIIILIRLLIRALDTLSNFSGTSYNYFPLSCILH